MRFAVIATLAFCLLASRAAAAPFVVGSGSKPGVAVDAAGTAYIAWYGPEAGTTSLQFCRLARGATACAGQRVIAAPGTSLSRPHVTVSGSLVRIVQYRYGVTPPQVFVFSSADGGNSFDGGRSAGEAPIEEAAFGPGDTIIGATNAWQNGGAVQRLPLADGSAGSSWAALFGTNAGGNGTVGYAPDGRAVAIFTGGVADASFRVHNGTGDPNSEPTWGPATALGYADYPRLASGPTGLFVLAGDAGGTMYARRWNGVGFDPAVTIGPGDASESHLFVDGGGRLHAVYARDDVLGHHLQHSVSDDGAKWSSGSALVQTDDQTGTPRVAAAADHVGVAVWSSRTAAGPEIRVSAVGPLPQFGKTVVVRVVSGKVRVRLKGSTRFVDLTTIDEVPLGSTLDTKRGVVELRSVPSRTGPVQSVQLKNGQFAVTQAAGITNFTLNEALAPCPKRGRAAARKPKSRKLWGDGKGAFRTSGRYSAATVRGTRWLVQDTCAGTLTRVTQGRVSVRDKVKRRTIVVRAGKRYTARPRR